MAPDSAEATADYKLSSLPQNAWEERRWGVSAASQRGSAGRGDALRPAVACQVESTRKRAETPLNILSTLAVPRRSDRPQTGS